MAAHRRTNLTGQRFGLLTALSAEGSDATSKVLWRCRCDCGNERIVTTSVLNNGQALHCGCGAGKKSRRQYRTEWQAKKRTAQKLSEQQALRRAATNHRSPLDVFLYGHPAP